MFTFQGVAKMQNNYVFKLMQNITSHAIAQTTRIYYIMPKSPDDLIECVLIKGFNQSPSLALSL